MRMLRWVVVYIAKGKCTAFRYDNDDVLLVEKLRK
jgi:hypothetical protein